MSRDSLIELEFLYFCVVRSFERIRSDAPSLVFAAILKAAFLALSSSFNVLSGFCSRFDRFAPFRRFEYIVLLSCRRC